MTNAPAPITESMKPEDCIFIAGHNGLVGKAITRNLRAKGFANLLTREHRDLDLLRQKDVEDFFQEFKIAHVVLAAGKVGGIIANSEAQADFLYENLVITTNVIKAAFDTNIKKLLFLGSSCIYPKLCPQPIKEDYLLSGPLEPTNEGYALAKIAGLKLCELYSRQYGRNFISVMPTNLYGPEDNFHPQQSHVIPGMMRRFHEAKYKQLPEVRIWGTGKPRREFLHVDDMAEAIYLLLQRYDEQKTINIGVGSDSTIAELAKTMKEVIGYKGEITYDQSKPDGTPQKLLDVSRLKAMGWAPSITLEQGLRSTYEWACAHRMFD